MGVVFLTALVYSELGSRFPQSGGVAIYIQKAFRHKGMSTFAGLLLFCATILSMATVSQAFVGYLRSLGLNFPDWLGVSGFLIILLLINIRGIKQSSIANMISTAVEVSGLLIVLGCGLWYLLNQGNQTVVPPTNSMPSMSDVFQGAALAFFAFTGFEDLANVAEEVKQPEKNLPRAILSSLGIAGLFYLGVSWMATAIIPGNELGQSVAPLLDVVGKSNPSMPRWLFSLIALFAVSNTTLLNYVTASRLLYGMSKIHLLPKFLQTVHHKYHTPYIAILLIFPLVLVLGVTGTLKELASSTSAIVLIVFSFSCLALIKIKFKEGRKKEKTSAFQIPWYVPCLAVVLNGVAISFLPPRSLIPAAIIVGIGLIVIGLFTYFVDTDIESV